MSSFLDQFEVKTLIKMPALWGFNFDFTNSSLSMVMATLVVILILYWSVRSQSLIPGRAQAFGEVVFDFINTTLEKAAGHGTSHFLPFMLTLFTFVMGCNLLGLVPGAFTATSQLAVNFSISLAVLVILTVYGVYKNGLAFFAIFLPQGVPAWLAPFIILIEGMAYIFRVVSLCLRLTANMVAGHVMLKVIASFGYKITYPTLLAGPTIFLIAVTAFELFVAALQAYIFVILSCVYLSDSFKKH